MVRFYGPGLCLFSHNGLARKNQNRNQSLLLPGDDIGLAVPDQISVTVLNIQFKLSNRSFEQTGFWFPTETDIFFRMGAVIRRPHLSTHIRNRIHHLAVNIQKVLVGIETLVHAGLVGNDKNLGTGLIKES